MGKSEVLKTAKGICPSCKKKGVVGRICGKCRRAFEAIAETVVDIVAASANLGGDS